MKRWLAAVALAGTFSQAGAVPAQPLARWQFAGENQGIRFHFKIANECRDQGAQVEVKLENGLDHAVVVSFRLVDPDWKKSFDRELGPRMTDAAVRFTPEEGTACHPYVDEVYVVSKETQVTHSESEPAAERMGTPDSPSPSDP
jgi:hypothetical protein